MSNLLLWERVAGKDVLSLQGSALIEHQQTKLKYSGNRLNFEFDADLSLNKIILSESFKIFRDDQEITANQGVINIKDNQLIAIGEVKLFVKEYALVRASRLELNLNQPTQIIATKVKSELFIR